MAGYEVDIQQCRLRSFSTPELLKELYIKKALPRFKSVSIVTRPKPEMEAKVGHFSATSQGSLLLPFFSGGQQ
jgi:hypothetical protein